MQKFYTPQKISLTGNVSQNYFALLKMLFVLKMLRWRAVSAFRAQNAFWRFLKNKWYCNNSSVFVFFKYYNYITSLIECVTYSQFTLLLLLKMSVEPLHAFVKKIVDENTVDMTETNFFWLVLGFQYPLLNFQLMKYIYYLKYHSNGTNEQKYINPIIFTKCPNVVPENMTVGFFTRLLIKQHKLIEGTDFVKILKQSTKFCNYATHQIVLTLDGFEKCCSDIKYCREYCNYFKNCECLFNAWVLYKQFAVAYKTKAVTATVAAAAANKSKKSPTSSQKQIKRGLNPYDIFF